MRSHFILTFAIAAAIVVVATGVAAAFDLGMQAPLKTVAVVPASVPAPQRQGGDTIVTAFTIASLPFVETGTTIGYNDDYDEMCPYGGAGPDVVYRFVSTMPQSVDVDLCGSNYDTKVIIYDAGLHFVACNDDFYSGEPCGTYVSKIENAPLGVGTYYIVVDGYGQSAGTYIVAVENHVGCVLTCPAAGLPEGEPPLVPNYVDNWNGGCDRTPTHPFQAIAADEWGERILCGVSGWYLFNGASFRDTDWYVFQMGASGTAQITADAQYATNIFELGPQDCGAAGVIQSATVGPCAEATMTISGYTEGEAVWFWVGPAVFADPDGGESAYDYVVWLTGLEAAVAVESTTWSTVKALYD
jgi:hypothetical protein